MTKIQKVTQIQKKILEIQRDAQEANPSKRMGLLFHALLLEIYVGFARFFSLFSMSKQRSFEQYALRDQEGSFVTSFTEHEKMRRRSMGGAGASVGMAMVYVAFAVFVPNVITPDAESSSFDFSIPGDYTYDSEAIDITAGIVSLNTFSATDADNTAAGFGGGTHSDTEWSAANSAVQLDATGKTNGTGAFTSRVLNAGGSVSWDLLSWVVDGTASSSTPVANYGFEESSAGQAPGGLDLTDDSGNSNHGTASGTITYADSGQVGSAATFNGSSKFTVSDSASLDQASEFTIQGWAKSSTNNIYFVDDGDDSSLWTDTGSPGCSDSSLNGDETIFEAPCVRNLPVTLGNNWELVVWTMQEPSGFGGQAVRYSLIDSNNSDRGYDLQIAWDNNVFRIYRNYCCVSQIANASYDFLENQWYTVRFSRTGSTLSAKAYLGKIIDFTGASPVASISGSNADVSSFNRLEISDAATNTHTALVMVRPYNTSNVQATIGKGNNYGLFFDSNTFAGFSGTDEPVPFLSDTNPTSGAWNHVAATYNGSDLKAYLNGAEVYSHTYADTLPTDNLDLVLGNLFNGSLDSVQVYDTALDAAEIGSIYAEAGLQTQLQVRSCDDAACSGESFVGPDGTSGTFYEESGTGSHSSAISNIIDNQYFQYQATLSNTDNASTPELESVAVDSNSYNSSDPTITNNTGIEFSRLDGFSETLGAGNEGTIEYQISNDGLNWYYWDGANFTEETGSGYPAETSSASEINTNAAAFSSDVGGGTFYFKAFLHSEGGAQAVELDGVSVDTSTNVAPDDPTIDNYDGGVWVNSFPISLQFDMNDTDTSDIIKYQIQVDNNSDFSSPEVDVTEASGSASPRANVTHSVTSLAAGDYYWRVKAIDDDAAESNWAAANSGAVAFSVDEGAPTASSVSINADEATTTSTSVTVSLLASDAEYSVTEMILSESAAFSGASWEAYGTSTPFTLSAGDGTKTIYVKFRDAAQNESSVISDTIQFDATSPSGTVSINAGAGYTNTPTVTLTIDGTDATSGVTQMMISETPTFSTASWEAYATSRAYTFSSVDGSRTVYVKFRDAAQNESAATSDSITLDTVAPAGTVSVSAGAAYATDRAVTLTTTASDTTSGVSEMMLSESSSFVGASWQPYATTASFTLSATDGTKTVYAKFKDASGLVSAASSDTIVLDTTKPTGTVSINSGSAYSLSATVTANLTASDAGSGLSQMMVSESSSFTGASWEAFAATKTVVLSGGNGQKTIYAKFKDTAGFISNTVSDTIVIDATAPVAALSINGGDDRTDSRSVTLTITANDADSGVSQMKLSENPELTGAEFETFATTKAFSLSAGDGEKTVYGTVKDAAGNVSLAFSASITLDTTVPESQPEPEPEEEPVGEETPEEVDVPDEVIDVPENPIEEPAEEEEVADSVVIHVIDDQGAPVEGASVTLSAETKESVTELTNAEGDAIFRGVQVGTYTAEIAFGGFVGSQEIEVSSEELAASDAGSVDVVVKLEKADDSPSPVVIVSLAVLALLIAGAIILVNKKYRNQAA